MKSYRRYSIVSFLLVVVFYVFLQFSVAMSFAEDFEPVNMDFWVYKDIASKENHYVPSGWMGDYNGIKMNLNCRDNPYEGLTCIKFTFNASSPDAERWAGVYFQHPTSNWGMFNGGYNLSKAKKLTFFARGEYGGEVIGEFKVGGINGGKYVDTASVSIKDIKLTKYWEKYTIDLENKDLTRIMGGFCWSASLEDNPDGLTFYIDEIIYE